jgi:hypothetical protein
VSINGGSPRPFVSATAEDGLPLIASPGVDIPAPFSFFPGAATIAIASGGALPGSGHPLTYRFYAQSLS